MKSITISLTTEKYDKLKTAMLFYDPIPCGEEDEIPLYTEDEWMQSIIKNMFEEKELCYRKRMASIIATANEIKDEDLITVSMESEEEPIPTP